MFRAITLAVSLVSLSCHGGDDEIPIGPGGAYALDMRCTPYNTTPNGDFCGTMPEQNYFQCDHVPGEDCVKAPYPSADPDQIAWCCPFSCTRYEVSDHRCPNDDYPHAYACTLEDPAAYAAEVGCIDSVNQALICC